MTTQKRIYKFPIGFEEFKLNKEECKDICNTNNGWLTSKKTKGDFEGLYITWSRVWFWLKSAYEDFNFTIDKVENDYIIGSLTIQKQFQGSITLNLETFTKKNEKTGEIKSHKETPEQLAMRLFVKLVAQYTGFGFHLWLK